MSLLDLKKKLFSVLCLALVLLVSAAAQSSADIGELFASETTAHGPALLAGTGMAVVGGSQVAAGKSVATLRLARGGEIRLCPHAGLTVSAVGSNVPQQSQQLMLSMDTGSIEFDYPLNDLADTLVTPDFKFLLAGPGVFHFALGVNAKGDTCIKPMRGNSASIIVSEMLGNSAYQIKADEALVFARGKLGGRGPLETECGCPPPAPVLHAENEQPKTESTAANEPAKAGAPTPKSVPTTAIQAPDVTAAIPAEKPGAVHVQVDVPLIFRGDHPEPAYNVARIRFSALPNVLLAQETQRPLVLKPGKVQAKDTKSKEKKGFFGRIKGFFAALFHR